MTDPKVISKKLEKLLLEGDGGKAIDFLIEHGQDIIDILNKRRNKP